MNWSSSDQEAYTANQWRMQQEAQERERAQQQRFQEERERQFRDDQERSRLQAEAFARDSHLASMQSPVASTTYTPTTYSPHSQLTPSDFAMSKGCASAVSRLMGWRCRHPLKKIVKWSSLTLLLPLTVALWIFEFAIMLLRAVFAGLNGR